MESQLTRIKGLSPSLGVPGGEITIHCENFRPGLPRESRVLVGQAEAGLVTASEDRIVVRLPDSPHALGVSLEVDGTSSAVCPFALATRLATELHPVANPVITPGGDIITTISGNRGQQIPQPLVKISSSGEKTPFPCELMNPTGLCMGKDGQLYISSRNDGSVLRYTDFDQLEVVAEDLGIACGIAFDSGGNLYVGDRSGKIYRLNSSWSREEYAVLEPSVSAYHLAFDAKDRLYVTGPTLSMRDPLYRIKAHGEVEEVLHGLARPQGMAFLPDGDLLIAAAYEGKKGIFRFSPETGQLVHFIAAPVLVGLAISQDAIILADSGSIYRLQPSWAVRQVV